jgi:hypothetical protein
LLLRCLLCPWPLPLPWCSLHSKWVCLALCHCYGLRLSLA